jgi:hypothetical protein
MSYFLRNKCIFCDNTEFDTLFDNDYESSISLQMVETKKHYDFMPYNILICNKCNAVQNKYLGNLDIVYGKNHEDTYGTTKSRKHTLFKDFIVSNNKINGIIEVGACHNILSELILDNIKTEYIIIDPSYTGDKITNHIINDYIENVNITHLHANTVIMSDVFEHFYNPKDILEKLSKTNNIEYIYLNHPDFDYSIKHNILINLNCEHTFLIEHDFLFKLFENYGFMLNRKYNFDNFSLFLEFKRNKVIHPIKDISFINKTLRDDIQLFFKKIINNVRNINHIMETNPNNLFYIWPCSVHSITLITMGLNYKRLSGILDNSPNKIGKYLYGYNLLCYSFDELVKTENNNISIIMGGAGKYLDELDIVNSKINFIF